MATRNRITHDNVSLLTQRMNEAALSRKHLPQHLMQH
jgi:hypothetical protein